jgi:hypothetical protein
MGYKTQVRNMGNKTQEESGDWERLREKIMRATGCSDEEKPVDKPTTAPKMKIFDPAKTPCEQQPDQCILVEYDAKTYCRKHFAWRPRVDGR